jgi:hypothetical protein
VSNHYLDNPLLCVRQNIALYYLNDGDDVIDIGCGNTPLYKFTNPMRFNSIVCVDPLLVIEDVPHNVSLYRCCLEEYVPTIKHTSVVLMGFDDRSPSSFSTQICCILATANNLIIEVSKWQPRLDDLMRLTYQAKKMGYERVVSIDLGFSRNKVFGKWNDAPHLERLLEVYNRKGR